jgi:hypothetical protein
MALLHLALTVTLSAQPGFLELVEWLNVNVSSYEEGRVGSLRRGTLAWADCTLRLSTSVALITPSSAEPVGTRSTLEISLADASRLDIQTISNKGSLLSIRKKPSARWTALTVGVDGRLAEDSVDLVEFLVQSSLANEAASRISTIMSSCQSRDAARRR